jgi:hypothetical protein
MGDRDPTGFLRVLQLYVGAFRSHFEPPILLQRLEDLPTVHTPIIHTNTHAQVDLSELAPLRSRASRRASSITSESSASVWGAAPLTAHWGITLPRLFIDVRLGEGVRSLRIRFGRL